MILVLRSAQTENTGHVFCRVCGIVVVTIIDLSCACMYSSSKPHNEFCIFFMKLSLA